MDSLGVTSPPPPEQKASVPAEPPRPDSSTSPRRNRRGTGRRLLIIGWCLWLMGTWGVLWLIGGWTVPALRAMVFSGVVGLMGLWPAVRLSQATGRPADGQRPGAGVPLPAIPSDHAWARVCGGTLLDWLCLNLVFQAVLWPLQMAAGWTLIQALWLDVSVAGWSLLTGLLIAWGRGTDRSTGRLLAMLVCVGVVVLEPALWWLGWQAGAVGVPMMRISPLQALWSLSATDLNPRQVATVIATQGVQVVSVVAAALCGWVVLGGLLLWRHVRRSSQSANRAAVTTSGA